MSKPKLIQINVKVAKQLVRVLERSEVSLCIGCPGAFHEEACPAKEIWQLHNYLTQRVNNPNKNYGI